MRAFVVGLVGLAAAACSHGSTGSPPPPASSSVAAATPSASASAAPANDGTDAKAPVLSPDDVSFADTRKGAGWSDRCFTEIKQGKWGWAHAACDRGLALPEVDPKVQPLLLYNEGLIAKHAADDAAARTYFSRSLAARAPADPGRAEVEKELVSVGGAVPAAPASSVEVFKDKALIEQMSYAKVKPKYSDLNFTTLYHADIDNDGHLDFILCEVNSTGLHNDQLLGVYLSAPSTGVMIDSEIPIPDEAPFAEGSVLYAASPFLRVDPEGTTMTVSEGTKRARYLWKGGHIRLLDRS